MKITHTHNAETITADVKICQGTEKKNRGISVYRVGMFQSDSDKRTGCGWALMTREYRTLKGIRKAAKKYHMGIIEGQV